MSSRVLTTMTAMALLAAAPAWAIPCGSYGTVGGVLQSRACRDGALGDAKDSVGDLNGGAGSGFNDWQELSRTSDDHDGGLAYWLISHEVGRKGGAGYSGTFTLSVGIWDTFRDLVVVLNDGGSSANHRIKWAAYRLPRDQYGIFNWAYDGEFKNISHLTLYGRVRPVAEPALLLLVATGLGGFFLLHRRRRAATPAV
ncbi:MAG: hypothetical protein FJ197_02320 [Gammaproteobacteria bacterium]|nr:hypothetical protein [Gammaproteobacteria bacterium]